MKYSILGFGFIANSQTHKVGGFYSSTDTMSTDTSIGITITITISTISNSNYICCSSYMA